MRHLTLTFAICGLIVSTTNAQFAGGNGTEEKPYQIETLEQLDAMRNEPDAHFVQTADIDASETVDWNDGEGFLPIRNFSGSFDGNGHEISGLTINRPDEDNIGLFGSISGADLDNVIFQNSSVTGGSSTGSLAGRMEQSRVRNSTSGIDVTGGSSVGGLVGY